jgi:crossover junction endodeoxyribonuclease RuvC
MLGQLIVVGIDCGKGGAIACLRDQEVRFWDMPTIRTALKARSDYDVVEMAAIIRDCGPLERLRVFLEKQQAMPAELHGRQQGVATSFQIGVGYGVWLGILGALGVSHEAVAPATWKRVMLADMPKGKEASKAKAKQLYPHAADGLRLVKHHNRAEALLIAGYGQRQLFRL